MRKFFILLILLTFAVPVHAATIYKWVDEEGVVNFTDNYNNVPSFYRDRAEVRDYLTDGVAPAYTLDAPPLKRAEAKTDIDGRDQTWWREKVRPWKEQLNQATENYENARKEYMEQADNLAQWRYGSLTQYQMFSSRLDASNTEMAKYRVQIAEANEMLRKLFKEAEESKANPAWLE
jgi:hypothetical protein